jgi:uncharacterized phage protein (TIGR02218 family)
MTIAVTERADSLVSGRSLLRLATCWAITRTDGEALYFTDHNAPIRLGGKLYTPAGGFSGSATRRETGLRSHSEEYRGQVTSDRITVDDLRTGRYQGATVTVSTVDWRYPMAGFITKEVYAIQGVQFDGETWVAEIEGMSRLLRAKIGDVFGRTCREVLGSNKCKVNLDAFRYHFVPITFVSNARSSFDLDPLEVPSLADNWFNFGYVYFLTGANAGLIYGVKTYINATRRCTLTLPAMFDIAVGDDVSITAGCDRRLTTCKTKFNNLVNHRAEPFLPGTNVSVEVASG